MIIYSNAQGIVGIPYKDKPKGKVVGRYDFLPGYNDVPKEIWDKARPEAKTHLDRKVFVEKYVTVEGDKIKSAKEFKELEPEQKEEIVKDTFKEGTLDDWKKEESGQDGVRAAIVNQKEEISNYTPKKGKKK